MSAGLVRVPATQEFDITDSMTRPARLPLASRVPARPLIGGDGSRDRSVVMETTSSSRAFAPTWGFPGSELGATLALPPRP